MNYPVNLIIMLPIIISAALFTVSLVRFIKAKEQPEIRGRRKGFLIAASILFFIMILICSVSCSANKEKKHAAVKVLIVPKFETGEMSGDDIGEAQLLYEEYGGGVKETVISNMPETAHFYVNKKNGTAILVTGSGKTACALAMTAVLSNENYDFSDSFIVSVGCAGGSAGTTTLGDIVLVTGACDNELGHTADIREFEDKNSETTWFPDSSYDAVSSSLFSYELAEQVYGLIKEYKPASTDISKSILKADFPGEEWALQNPRVIKGTALSGDSFWKGEIGHNNALKIIETYKMPDPYAVTEMEELTVANVARCYGLLDRVISLRAVVDLDVFLGNDSPESLWTAAEGYNNNLGSESSTALDIFEPAMHSLFDVSKTVIDAVLAGKIGTDK